MCPSSIGRPLPPALLSGTLIESALLRLPLKKFQTTHTNATSVLYQFTERYVGLAARLANGQAG
jgi:hypothetical protein